MENSQLAAYLQSKIDQTITALDLLREDNKQLNFENSKIKYQTDTSKTDQVKKKETQTGEMSPAMKELIADRQKEADARKAKLQRGR